MRSFKIKENIDSVSLGKIKKSGSNLRLYKEILEKVDFDNEIWLENIEPDNELWINFIFKQIEQFNHLKWEMGNGIR